MSDTPRPRSHADTFRPDIEGLRGVAVLLVVLFHAGIAPITGGFVGVDVFFVISGFLITGLLLRERAATGRIALTAFYARRVRRLLPAASVVLLGTLAAAWLVLDPLSRGEVLLDGAASALSVANLRFAAVASDYFAPAVTPSPFLHFWSLAVEEQFYLVWPALFAAAFVVGRNRFGVAIVIGAVLAGSFAAEIVLTDASPGLAFYLLPTRAWQLAAGALLAIALGRIATTATRWHAPLALAGWAGLAAIAWSAVALDATTPYPGVAALAPTLGAVGIVAAGAWRTGPASLLAIWPLRFAGRISYALYLWHWPLLIIGPAAVPVELTPAGRLGLVGLAVLLATASTFLVEEPIRRGVAARPGRTVSAGLVTIAACAIVATSLSVASSAQLDRLGSDGPGVDPSAAAEAMLDEGPVRDVPIRGPAAGEPAGDDPAATAEPDDTGDDPSPTKKPKKKDRADDRTGTKTRDPKPPKARTPDRPRGDVRVLLARERPVGVSTTFTPSLKRIRTDEERLKADRCIAWEPETEPRPCRYGNGSFTVALVGDSHASHWFPALHAVVRARGWSVVPMVKVSCPFIDMPVHSNALKREYRECARFNDAVLDRLEAVRPDLTIVALNQWVLPHDPDSGKVAAVGAALARQLNRIPGKAVLLADNPHSKGDVPTCIAKHASDLARCATPYAKAYAGHAAIETVAARTAGVPLIDLAPAICAQDPCPDVVDGIVVYRDYHHLTATFSRSLAPELGRLLRKVVR